MSRWFLLGILVISFLSLSVLAQNATETYQRALVQEQAAGNLKEAIRLYQTAAKEAGDDRALAARALIRAAASQEKLGEPQAAETYTEILRTYSEQHEQVEIAQVRLAAIRRSSPATSKSAGGVRTDVSAVFDPIIASSCVSCHNQSRKLANLSLESLSRNVSDAPETWEKILKRLRARRDPPPGQPRPNEGVYESLTSTLELALDQAYPVNASLNSAERVTDAELASRMAAFIWNGTPDTVLLDAVQRGRLREPAVLEQQVRRMLRDPKAVGLVSNFFEKWALGNGLERIDAAQAKGWPRFPGFDDELRQAFAAETRLFFQSQLRDDRDALEVWTANYTWVNERLARHYGIPGVTGNEYRRVTLNDASRAGLLGQASVLTVTSLANRTSPTMRGKWILQSYLGLLPPDPPPNIAPLKDGGREDSRSMRARLADHTVNPACMNCHGIFEPMGLALDNFNPIGAWQRTDGSGAPLDVSGTFVDGSRFNGPAELRAGLVKYREAYYQNITSSMLGYAIGRKGQAWRLYDYEMPSVRAIVRGASANEYRWSSIVLGVVKSTPFQLKNLVP